MPPIRIVSLAQVASILGIVDREDILISQAKAFHSHTAHETQMPLRSSLYMDYHTALIMPARINTSTSAVSAVKIVSIPKKDSKNGLPGVTVVMDNETGEPRGLVNARLLTAIRTAAASALATRAIFSSSSTSRNKTLSDESQPLGKPASLLTLVIFGSGAQAKAHIQMLIHVIPQICKVVICNRTLPRAQELMRELQPQYSSRSSGNNSTNHIIEIEVFCTSTGESTNSSMASPSATPESLKEGLKKIIQAFILADAREECEEEAGEIILAKKLTGQSGILAELGEIFDEHGQLDHAALPSEFKSLASCRNSDGVTMDAQTKDVSIFKSVGIAAQDVAITALVLDKAEVMNLGSVTDF
ncbi:hypothetical protein BGZ65_001719 [Modicella reniformis]|uniref:NAD(P)-binding protein n=1 Tax=Modicella reniformis TaxID=1440133 RepID=A0A9P6LTC1_9FUNG|nr:hypothetical protein BGZ65_001719 [Modicella reniformis]